MTTPLSGQSLKPLGRILNLMDEGWTVWDCAPIWGRDGKVHVFASRWRHGDRPDAPDQAWFLGSEIIHAVAKLPEGPYKIRDIVLQGDGSDDHWDSSALINPKIYQVGEKYCLLYTGCRAQRHDTQAIGMLVSPTLDGPWQKVSADKPLVAPEPDRKGFDGYLCNNAALLQHPNGQFWVYYKGRDIAGDGSSARGMRIGLAVAERLEGPYRKHPDNPLLDLAPAMFEDPTVWRQGQRYFLLASDINVLTGQGGLLFESEDGIHWSPPQKGYPGAGELLGREQRLEEPNLLFQAGRATHLFNMLGACPQDPVYSGFVCAIDEGNEVPES
jgi:beta-xylosidase